MCVCLFVCLFKDCVVASGQFTCAAFVDILLVLHVPGWCLQRHDYEGNSWRPPEEEQAVPQGQTGGLVLGLGLGNTRQHRGQYPDIDHDNNNK